MNQEVDEDQEEGGRVLGARLKGHLLAQLGQNRGGRLTQKLAGKAAAPAEHVSLLQGTQSPRLHVI